MSLNHTPQFTLASDRSILVQFGQEISEEIHQRVFAFTDFVLTNRIKSVVNIHPAYSSVLFTLDLNADLKEILSLIKKSWEASTQTDIPKMRQVEIPVLYGGELGEDMDRVSQHTGLNQSEIIQCHEGGLYKVYFTGFSPGFPYIGGMDETLSTPRLDTPRKKVPLGSVAVANNQTGIYPIESPGGWNLIGRTPLPIFNINDPENSLVDIGDKLHFRSISQDEFDQMKGK